MYRSILIEGLSQDRSRAGIHPRKGMKTTLFFPLQGSTLEFVDKTNNENKSKKEHGTKDRNAGEGKFSVGENPGNKKNDIDIEKDKKHRGYIKFY